MAIEGLMPPASSTQQGMYSWATQHVVQLRRILEDVSTAANPDVSALLAQVAALQSGQLDLDARIDSLEGIATALQTDVTSLETNYGIVTSQITDLDGQVFTIGGEVDALVPVVTGLDGQVIALGVRTDTLETNFVDMDALVDSVDIGLNSLSSVYNRDQTDLEIAADATIRAAIEAHRASTGIRTQVTVSHGLAQQIESLSATLNTTNASVTTLTAAVADGDSALATQITDVESQVAGNTASVTTLTSAVNGIYTRWGVTLNAQGEVIGSATLDGTPVGTAFTLNVDKFQVGKDGTAGGGFVPVFAILNVSGAAKIALRGDMLADGAIVARTIAADQVTADHIQAGAITAAKMNVGSLDAISVNAGTLTSGIIRDAANTYQIQIANGLFTSTDGLAFINLKTKQIKMRA